MTQTQQRTAQRFDDMVRRSVAILEGTKYSVCSVKGSAQHYRPLNDMDESPEVTARVIIHALSCYLRAASFTFPEVQVLRVALNQDTPDTSIPAVNKLQQLEQATALLQEWRVYAELMGWYGHSTQR